MATPKTYVPHVLGSKQFASHVEQTAYINEPQTNGKPLPAAERDRRIADPAVNPAHEQHVQNFTDKFADATPGERVGGIRWYPSAARDVARAARGVNPGTETHPGPDKQTGYHEDAGAAEMGFRRRANIHGFAATLAGQQTDIEHAAQKKANEAGHGEEFARTGSHPGYTRQHQFEHPHHSLQAMRDSATPEQQRDMENAAYTTAHMSPAATGMAWNENAQATYDLRNHLGRNSSFAHNATNGHAAAFHDQLNGNGAKKSDELKETLNEGPLKKSGVAQIKNAVASTSTTGDPRETFSNPVKTSEFGNAIASHIRSPEGQQHFEASYATVGAEGHTAHKPETPIDGHMKAAGMAAKSSWSGGRGSTDENHAPNELDVPGHNYWGNTLEEARQRSGSDMSPSEHQATVWGVQIRHNAERVQAAKDAGDKGVRAGVYWRTKQPTGAAGPLHPRQFEGTGQPQT